MRFIDERTIRDHVVPADVFQATREYLSQTRWRDAPGADDGSTAPPVKVGWREERPAAWRIRTEDGPPRYLTILPDAVVSATWLTYQRTAALMLVAPWLALARRSASILVVGAGRLGRSTARMAADVFDGATVAMYARSPGPPLGGVTRTEHCPPGAAYDLIATATSATGPLPPDIPLAGAGWLAIGGSARSGAELIGVQLAGRREHTDHRPNALARRILTDPAPLTDATPDGTPGIALACGGGGIDGYLAERYLNHIEGRDW